MKYQCTCGYKCDDWEKEMLHIHYKEKHPKRYQEIMKEIVRNNIEQQK